MGAEKNSEKGVLAGLVSERAEALYRRALATGGVSLAPGPEVDDEAVAELLDAGVAFRSGEADALLRPVSQASALRTLLDRAHRDLGERQRLLLDGWERLAEQLPSTVDTGSGGSGNGAGRQTGVRLLTDVTEISKIAKELWHVPTSRFRGTETGDFPTRPTKERVFLPPPALIERGVRFQMIYQASYRTTTHGNDIIEESVAAREEVRLRDRVPTKFFLVDDTVALVALDRAGTTALLVRAPALLTLIREWFDAMWADATSVVVGGDTDTGLTVDQHRVLEQMVLGHGDDTIARHLNVSVRTVRRHVTVIYEKLGVHSRSRFAAGYAAAEKGWLRPGGTRP